MSYDGFFIRDYVGETIDGSKGTSWTNSPDIICSGPTPLADPKTILNADNYNKGLPIGYKQSPEMNNWVYVRGVNPQTVPQKTTIYMYYADSSVMLWPQNWKYREFMYAGEYQNWASFVAPARTDNLGLQGTIPPFGWTPPTKYNYCLVAWAKNGPQQNIPPDLQSIGKVSDLGKFIISNPNIGWKNTIAVDATKPTLTGTAPIDGPPEGGILNIGLQCDKIPKGGYIEFFVPGPNEDNTIIFPKTKIEVNNYAPTVQVEYPAVSGGYKTQLTWNYYEGTTPASDGANIIPFAGTWGLTTDFIDIVRKTAPQFLADVHHYGTPVEFARNIGQLKVPIRTMMIVGSIPFRFTR